MANPFRRDNFEPPEPLAYNRRGLTAAASRINLKDKRESDLFRQRQGSQTAAWQTAAWEYYDAISEIKYAFNLVASIMSRIRLYAAVIEDPAESPVPVGSSTKVDTNLGDAAIRILARLDSAYGGQPGLLRDAALNLAVAGECYLVQVPERPGQGLPETWDIRSISELRVDQRGNYGIYPRRDIQRSNNNSALPVGAIQLPEGAFMGRIWRAHPQYSEDPDSSMLGLLGLCDELLLLDRTFRGSHRSRLNSGIFFVPDGISAAATADPDLFADIDDEQPSPEDLADEFEEQLILGLSTPIEDETSVHGVMPVIIRGPSEMGDKLKHISFSRPFDDSMVSRADRVLDRIMQGLDVPKDTVTGLANVKYSNAIQIDESLYKAHIEPTITSLAESLTVIYLRPALIEAGFSQAEVARLTIWFDASAVATRNDRAMDADSGYEKKAISGSTWRRAHGFSDQDAPDSKELVIRMLMDKGAMQPELTEALLWIIAPEMMEAMRGAQQAQSVAPIPGQAADILAGGTGAAPAAPGADPAAPVDPAAAPPLTDPEQPVPPGSDAPPFPLAEPGQ